MARSPRPFPAAAAVLATVAFALTGAAGIARADMVVIATTAPTVAPGRVVAGGERLDLPPGAAVTLLAADGRSVTLTGPGGVVPTDDAPPSSAAGGGGLLNALAALLGGGDASEGTAIAAVRNVQGCPTAGRSEVERIAELARRGCVDEARAQLSALVARTAPAGLYLTTDPDGASTYRIGDRLGLRLQTNFDAYVYCYYGQADGRVIPIFPDGEAGGGRVAGNRAYRLPDELRITHPSGTETVTCFATDRDVGAELPAPLVERPFEPLPDDVAARLAAIFAGLKVSQRADARLVLTVVP